MSETKPFLLPAISEKGRGLIRVSDSLNITNKILEEYKNRSLIQRIKSVIIGTQEWMTVNLNVDCFRNGDPIPEVKSDADWEKALNEQRPAWCYYNNDPSFAETYGRLYNFYAIFDQRGLSPMGWHIPCYLEWKTLYDFVGGGGLGAAHNAFIELKSNEGWSEVKDAYSNPTNSTGFSALPSGARWGNGKFWKGHYCWSTTLCSFRHNWARCVCHGIGGTGDRGGDFNRKLDGMSVRCLKDTASIKSIIIGTQEWMVENLSVIFFQEGYEIEEARSKKDWQIALKYKRPAYCYFENHKSNGKKYGILYNWYAINSELVLAPSGWHIPSNNEWDVLIENLGGIHQAASIMHNVGWDFPEGKIPKNVNSFGFSALPIGFRLENGFYVDTLGKDANWWTKDEEDIKMAYARSINSNDNRFRINTAMKGIGYSVRCLKNT